MHIIYIIFYYILRIQCSVYNILRIQCSRYKDPIFLKFNIIGVKITWKYPIGPECLLTPPKTTVLSLWY